MSTARSFFLPPLQAKPRPIVVETVRASASGYAVAMTRLLHGDTPKDAPKQAGPKPRYAQPKRSDTTPD